MSHTPTNYMLAPNMQKYPSMTSVNTMFSVGHIPAGHGYVPRKPKPDKPYGLSYMTVLNRTRQGPGHKYLLYASICGCLAMIFFTVAAVYFGLRNVSRLIVYRTEVLGVILIIFGIIFVSMMFQLFSKAREESNRWRMFLRFKPEGLTTAAPFNYKYAPEMKDREGLETGTIGPKALTIIPKKKYMKKLKAPRSATATTGNVTPVLESSIEMTPFNPIDTSTLPRNVEVLSLPNEERVFHMPRSIEAIQPKMHTTQFIEPSGNNQVHFDERSNHSLPYSQPNVRFMQNQMIYDDTNAHAHHETNDGFVTLSGATYMSDGMDV